MPTPLELALFTREFAQEVGGPYAPAWLQRMSLAPPAWLAARGGRDARYSRRPATAKAPTRVPKKTPRATDAPSSPPSPPVRSRPPVAGAASAMPDSIDGPASSTEVELFQQRAASPEPSSAAGIGAREVSAFQARAHRFVAEGDPGRDASTSSKSFPATSACPPGPRRPSGSTR